MVTLVQPLFVHSLPWYNGMGWTVGTGHSKWDTLVQSLSVHSFPGTLRWDNVFFSMFTQCLYHGEHGMGWDNGNHTSQWTSVGNAGQPSLD